MWAKNTDVGREGRGSEGKADLPDLEERGRYTRQMNSWKQTDPLFPTRA